MDVSHKRCKYSKAYHKHTKIQVLFRAHVEIKPVGKNVPPNNEELKSEIEAMLKAILFDFPNTINPDECRCLVEDFIISLNNVHTIFLARSTFDWKTAGNLKNPLVSSESLLSLYFPFLCDQFLKFSLLLHDL